MACLLSLTTKIAARVLFEIKHDLSATYPTLPHPPSPRPSTVPVVYTPAESVVRRGLAIPFVAFLSVVLHLAQLAHDVDGLGFASGFLEGRVCDAHEDVVLLCGTISITYLLKYR